MFFLMPQLPTLYALLFAKELATVSMEECRSRRLKDHPNRIYSPTGGMRIPDTQYFALCNELTAKAEKAGYPKENAAARAEFDVEAAIFLHREFPVSDNEAAKDGVWNFLSCIALPDLVRWRWLRGDNEAPQTRFLAGRKNTFQRLWWKAHAFYDTGAPDPYWLIREIGEDESVGVMERTTLSGMRPLVRAILKSLLKASTSKIPVSRSDLMRDAMKRFRRLGGIVAFDTLEPDEIADLCDRIFAESIVGLSHR